MQQQLGPTVNCERFQQIYPQSFTPESPPSALGITGSHSGTQLPALGFCPSGAHYPMGQRIQEILPPSAPASSFLEAQGKAPPGTGSHRTGTESQGFGVWCLLGDTAPAQGCPGKPPCPPPCQDPPNSVTIALVTVSVWALHSGDRMARPVPRCWERPHPGRAPSTPGQVGPAGGASPALTSS